MPTRSAVALAAAATAAVWLAGCDPLPHPFAADAPRPGSPILALPDDASVAIPPIRGEPRAAAAALAPAMAKALQRHEVAASDRTAAIGGYQLRGTIRPLPASRGKAGVFVRWELRDAKGKPVGERAYALEAGADDWRDGAAVTRLAAASAERVAPMLLQPPPVETAPAGGPRLLIGEIAGAPGDGGHSLVQAMSAVLKRQDLAVATGAAGKNDAVLDAEVHVGRPDRGKQHVGIVWRVRRGDGSEVGTVAQQNDVPAHLLDGAWGDVAYMVALSAQDGIVQLVRRAGPPATAATGAPPPAGKS